jgi:hypothetical protein
MPAPDPRGPAAGDDVTAAKQVCPTCHVAFTGSWPTPAAEQLEPSTWTWSDPATAAALRAGELGVILHAYRRVHALTQAQLAARPGYD